MLLCDYAHKYDICLCKASEGYLCMLKQVLHPVNKTEWCISALFISDQEQSSNHCLIDSKLWHTNLAVSLI